MEREPEEVVYGMQTSLNSLLAGVASPSSFYFRGGNVGTGNRRSADYMQHRRRHQPPQPQPQPSSATSSNSSVPQDAPGRSEEAQQSPRRSRRVAAARSRQGDSSESLSSTDAVAPSAATSTSVASAASKPAPKAARKRSAAAAASTSGKKSAAARPKRARRSPRKPPPNAKDDSQYETEGNSKKDGDNNNDESSHSCCICMSEPDRQQLSTINGCGHHFCFDCIAKWAERENKCPLCKVRFTKIARVHKTKSKRGEKRTANTKSVRNRDQRSDLVSGAALEAMLNSIAASSRNGGGPGSSFRSLFGPGNPAGRQFRPAAPGSFRLGDWLEGSGDSDEDDSLHDMGGFSSDFNAMMRRSLEMSRENRRTRQAAAVAAAANASVPMPPPPPSAGMPWGPLVAFPTGMPLGNTMFHHHTFQMAPPLAPDPLPPNAYAANNGEDNAAAAAAGSTATNPLVIDLCSDDDDDDDEVEFVGTSATMSNR